MQTRECHKCPLYGYPTEECITCLGAPELSNKGRRYVYTDSLPAADELIESERLDRREPKGDDYSVTNFDPDTEDALRIVLAKYMALEPIDRLVFDFIFHGLDLGDTAAAIVKQGEAMRTMTKQAVHKRLMAMRRRAPEMFAVCRQMIREGVGGAAKKGTRPRQTEMRFY